MSGPLPCLIRSDAVCDQPFGECVQVTGELAEDPDATGIGTASFSPSVRSSGAKATSARAVKRGTVRGLGGQP